MAKNTSIVLGDHFDNFVTGEINSGRFHSVSEVIRAALRLLETEEQKLKALRNELEHGENSGITDNFDAKKHLQELRKKHL